MRPIFPFQWIPKRCHQKINGKTTENHIERTNLFDFLASFFPIIVCPSCNTDALASIDMWDLNLETEWKTIVDIVLKDMSEIQSTGEVFASNKLCKNILATKLVFPSNKFFLPAVHGKMYYFGQLTLRIGDLYRRK